MQLKTCAVKSDQISYRALGKAIGAQSPQEAHSFIISDSI